MILPTLAKIFGISIETLLTGEAETTYVPEEKRKSFEETILYVHVKEGTENIQLNLRYRCFRHFWQMAVCP